MLSQRPLLMSLSPNKRQAILTAARNIFLRLGYSGASMEAIAEEAPVSKPTLYNHFHSKHELFAAVIVDHCSETLIASLHSARESTRDPAEGLRTIARSFVDVVYDPESLALYRTLIAEQQQFPELGAWVFESSAQPVIDAITDYLTQLHAQRKLMVPDPAQSGQFLLGLLKGIPHLRCLLGIQKTLTLRERETLVEEALLLFLRGHGHG